MGKFDILSVTSHRTWLLQNGSESYQSFKNLDTLPPNDSRRLIAMDPARLKKLLTSDDVTLVAQYHHYFDDLVCLRRSAASTILIDARDDNQTRLSLRAMMPKHETKTIELSWRPEEGAEFQWFHFGAARNYINAIKDWMYHGGPGKDKGDPNYYPNVTQHLRHMTLFTTSLLLGRFELVRSQMGYSTRADDIAKLRESGFNAHCFIKSVHRDGDGQYNTGEQRLAFMAYGSPKLRYLMSQIANYVLPGDGTKTKLLGLEAYPNAA